MVPNVSLKISPRTSHGTRALLVGGLFVAGSVVGGSVVAGAGCSAGNGDEELRPQVLTPTKRTPQDIVAMADAPKCELPVPDPPPAPVGTPDSAGYISGPPQECNGPDLMTKCIYGTPAPDTGVLLDFTSYTMPAGTWGTASLGQFTGGTSLYSGTGTASDAITQAVTSDKLHIQAAIPAGGYSGIVFWFGPCVNASAFSGVQFDAAGQLGGATMIVKAQSSPDYPIDAANSKGKCRYKVDANKFTECQQPTVNINALPASGTVSLPWAMFTGGIPVANIDPAQLLGFELQFSCTAPPAGSSSCALNLDLGKVSFTKP
jgi:hypothetical protein